MNEILLEILIELKKLREEVAELKKDVDELKTTCGRMDGHISFVERTYETLKTPIDYIKYYCNKPINYLNNDKEE